MLCPNCSKPKYSEISNDGRELCQCPQIATVGLAIVYCEHKICQSCRAKIEAEKLREGYDKGYAKCVKDNTGMIELTKSETRQKCWEDFYKLRKECPQDCIEDDCWSDDDKSFCPAEMKLKQKWEISK